MLSWYGECDAVLCHGDAYKRRYRSAGQCIERGTGMSVESLIFEKGAPGRRAASMPSMDVPTESLDELIPAQLLRTEPAALPEVSEIEVVRHYTHLSQRNFGIETGFYPLGSCTMKYNPKRN